MRTKEEWRRLLGRLKRDYWEKGEVVLASPLLVHMADCLLRCALAALLAQARLLEGYSPFAMALVGASGSGVAGFAALMGASLGYLGGMGFAGGLRCVAASILIYAVEFGFFDLRIYRTRWFMPLSAALMDGATGFVYLSESGWRLSQVLGFGTEVVLVGVFCALLRELPLLSERKKQTENPAAPRLCLLAALLVTLERFELWRGISLGGILASLTVLAASVRGWGAAAGTGIGIGLDLAAGTGVYGAMLGFGGLLSGAARRGGRVTRALCFVAGSLGAVFWLGGADSAAWEAALGAVLSLALPARLLSPLERRFPEPARPEAFAGYPRERERQKAQQRLEEQSAAFRTLYEQMRDGFSTHVHESDVRVVFDRAAERVCPGCALRAVCWKRDYLVTYNALTQALSAMVERGHGELKDFPASFAGRCMRMEDFLAACNEELHAYWDRQRYEVRVRVGREAVCRQYEQLSRLLGEAAVELGRELTPDERGEELVMRTLRGMGCAASAALRRDSRGRCILELEGKGLQPVREELRHRLSAALGVALEPGELTRTREGQHLIFLQSAPLAATVGIAARHKAGQEVSGDSGTWFRDEEGVLWLAVCDGMGVGPTAAAESRLALRLLEDFLRAGVEPEPALGTLTGALALQGEVTGGFSTVDLMRLDLFTGAAAVYKLGAAPTYLRRSGSVTRITGTALPAGAGPERLNTPDVTRFTMGEGDLALLVSDGVTDGEDDHWLRTLMTQFPGGPRDLALAVLEQGEQQDQDDRTVVAVRLSARRPEDPAEP